MADLYSSVCKKVGIKGNVALIKEGVKIRGAIGNTIVQHLVGEGDNENAFDAQVIGYHGDGRKRKCSTAHNLSEYHRDSGNELRTVKQDAKELVGT